MPISGIYELVVEELNFLSERRFFCCSGTPAVLLGTQLGFLSK
jgi:hypothetical protein